MNKIAVVQYGEVRSTEVMGLRVASGQQTLGVEYWEGTENRPGAFESAQCAIIARNIGSDALVGFALIRRDGAEAAVTDISVTRHSRSNGDFKYILNKIQKAAAEFAELEEVKTMDCSELEELLAEEKVEVSRAGWA